MLRVLEITVVVAIVVYGFIKLIEMFNIRQAKKEVAKATALDELAKQAEEVAQKKRDILDETEKTKEQINNINNTLN